MDQVLKYKTLNYETQKKTQYNLFQDTGGGGMFLHKTQKTKNVEIHKQEYTKLRKFYTT